MVNQNLKNKILIILMLIVSSACSAPNDAQGVVSTQDLSTDTTVITVLENVVEETLTPEDAQLLLARCLRDNGYDVQDPKNNEGSDQSKNFDQNQWASKLAPMEEIV